MDPKRIALEAIRQQIQRIAVDANLYDMGLATYPYAEKCSKKRKKLLVAIKELEKENAEHSG